ncbi:MAG: winged helix-turn-helix domain-containing protein [Sulfitobacter sp.]
MSRLFFRVNDCYGKDVQSRIMIPEMIRSAGVEQPNGKLTAYTLPSYVNRKLRIRPADDAEIGVTSLGQSMSSASRQIRLGNATYHVETESLITATGDEVMLRSQSAIVLRFLAENLGVLVTRDDLVAKVWPDVAVTDDSLTQCISDIRKAMGDKSRSILKTVPKRGYILRGEHIAPQEPVADTQDIAAAALQFSAKRMAAVAIADLSEPVEVLIKRFPPGLHPVSTVVQDAGAMVLIYDAPATSLQAALYIASATGLAVAVDFTQGDGREVCALLRVATKGEVLTSPDVSATVDHLTEFVFHDLGEVTPTDGTENLRPYRVSTGGAHRAIIPQLDAKDVLPTLAVLPFRTQSGGPENMLGTFLADEVANAISRSEDVNVISRLSTGSVGGHVGNLRDLGQLLNADFILSGTLFQKDNSAIAIIEFAETETQYVLWSDRMELSIDPHLGEVEGVAQIVAQIRKAITLNEVRRVRSRPLHDLKLFSVLHGAVGLMHRLSPKEFQQARSFLEYVISKAPKHPAPLAWLARWHVLRTVQGWTEDAGQEAAHALELTARALDIDSENTLALLCEGQVLANMAHRLDEAKDRYDTALTINPNDAQGRALRGALVSFQDRGIEGKRDAERALHLTPLDPHRFMFLVLAAGANISAEDYPRAVILAKESLRLNRTHVSTLRVLTVAQEGAGQHVEAKQTASELLRLQPDLRVGKWLKNTPSADYHNGRRFADMLRAVGIPE